MGIFDWLKRDKSNVEIAGDRMWLTKQAKLQSISSEVAQAIADTHGPFAIFLVAHFQNCFEELRALVQQSRFDDKSVLVAMAEDLEAHSPRVADFGESQWVRIMVAERHPLPSHDESLIAFARTVSCHCRIIFHVSLDEPLMQLFAGEWVKQTLERLGMSENEAIESRMLARRIREAQKKIERRATGDMPADSAEEWFGRNCPMK